MGSPETVDFERLLAPIPGDNLAGASVRTDFTPSSIYFKAKDARNAARTAEKQMLFEDEGAATTTRPDWRAVSKLCTQILAEQSKDLEVASWLIEALVREEGFAGLRDGFRLVRSLIEQFWDVLYPLPDEDGVLTRVAPLAGLNGEESPGALITPINNVPITEPGDIRALAVSDYRQAADLERVDVDKRARRIEQGAVTLELFSRSVLQTPTDFYSNLLEDLTLAIEEFDSLSKLLDEKCGNDEYGHSAAPPTSYIRSALEECKATIESVTRGRLGGEVIEGEDASTAMVAAGSANRPSTNGNHLQTRDAALREVLRVADYFKRNEPHSPIAYHLEQAVRWAQMPLPELWAELIPDESTRAQLFRLVGINQPEQSS